MKQIRITLLFILLAFSSLNGYSQLNISSAGDWSDPTIWDSNPNIGDTNTEDVTMDANIGGGGEITILSTESFSIGTIDTNTGNTLTIENGGALTVGVDPTPSTTTVFTTFNNTTINVDGTLIINGKLLVNNNLTLNVSATGTLIITGDIQLKSGGTLNIQGDVDVGGNFVAGSNTSIAMSGSGFLNIDGSLSLGGGTSSITGPDNSISVGGTCSVGGGACPSGPLPIELGSFTAKVSGNNVKLDWVTLSEINNDYFSIEKSSDGINYTLMTTVNGAGNSIETLEYSYIDTNPSFGKSYYRLKQTDFDGASETFAPIAVEFTSLENGKLTFSNPVNAGETVSIFTNAESTEKLTLSVFSMMGHEILNEEFIGSSYEFKIDASVEPGIYFVKVSSVNSERTGRLVVK